MLSWLTDWSGERAKAKELYGAVVTQARQPLFFAGLGVPDTTEGRYEMVVLHLFLLLERLRAEGEPAKGLSRRLIETFVTDMDDSMREMGVGDLSVPKHVKRAAAGLYERAGEYREALAGAEPGLVEAALMARLVDAGKSRLEGERPPAADLIAEYMRSASAELARQPFEAIKSGQVAFPPVLYVEM
jgi:cytochrome b pre-mRNA-processing protein 3